MKRPGVAVATVCAAVVLTGLPALANGGVAMAVDIHNSSQTLRDRDRGVCTWEVLSDVIIVNLRSEPNTLEGVSFTVSWIGPDDRSGVVTDIAVLNDGGLRPGVTISPDGRERFSPVVVQFRIPCDATFGDLAVRVTSSLGTGSGDAPFLEDGTPVPPGAVGAIALAVLLAGHVALAERRRRLVPAPAIVRDVSGG